MYLIGEGLTKKVRWRWSVEEDPLKKMGVREGPSEKMADGDGPSKKVRR